MTDEKATSLTDALLILPVITTLVVLLISLRAYIFADLWAMFVAPTWGVATPSFTTAFGMLAGYSVLNLSVDKKYKDDDNGGWELAWRGVGDTVGLSIVLLILWGIAAAVHSTWGH